VRHNVAYQRRILVACNNVAEHICVVFVGWDHRKHILVTLVPHVCLVTNNNIKYLIINDYYEFIVVKHVYHTPDGVLVDQMVVEHPWPMKCVFDVVAPNNYFFFSVGDARLDELRLRQKIVVYVAIKKYDRTAHHGVFVKIFN
jgi:hypothetical protein